jgi:HEAT repeat protein
MPTKLAQHLVARGLLPAAKVEEALRRQTLGGGSLDTVLLEQGVISEAGMLQALSDASGVRLVNLADFEPNFEVAQLIPPKIAERLTVAPLSVDGDTLHVACSYPVPTQSLHEVGFLLGKQLELWVALECRIRDWIAAVYKKPLGARYSALLAALDPSRPLPASALAAPAPIARPESRGTGLVEVTTLEESLSSHMVEKLAQSVIDEPILLEVKKPAKVPEPRTPAPPAERPRVPLASDLVPTTVRPIPTDAHTPWDRVDTVVLDTTGYAAFAKAAGKPAPARPVVSATPLTPVGPLSAPKAEPLTPFDPPAPKTEALTGFDPPVAKAPAREALPKAEAPASLSKRPPTQTEFPVQGAPPPRPGTQQEFSAVPTQHEPWRVPQSAHALGAPPAPLAANFPAPELPVPAQAQGPSSGLVAEAPTQRELRAVGRVAPAQDFGSSGPATSGNERAPEEPPQDQSAQHFADREVVPEWTLAEARGELKEASRDRERIIDVTLRYARRTFDFTAAFAVVRGAAVGWDARGEGAENGLIGQLSIPLDAASVFRTVAMSRGSYVGPLPPDALSAHFLTLLARAPRTVFLFPVEVKSRLVAIIYGDCGGRPMSQRRLSDTLLFCQDLPAAFHELIVFRKQRVGPALSVAGPVEAPYEEPLPEPPPAPPAPVEQAPVPGLRMGWGMTSSSSGTGMGRAASMPVMVLSESERPPSDFAPMLRRLVGPDAAQRARAMAELSRTPEASAKVLAGAFPGPTAWSRLPVLELPEADELGPIPAALSRLGRYGAQALAPLLDSGDSDTRYLALLTAGNLPYGELVDGVLRGLFDLEPDTSSAARAAATAMKRLPRFDAAMKDLRQELAARDSLRRSLAARALGNLHDRDAVDGLIGLTGSDDQMCAQAATEALREITKCNFGPNPRSWTAWWAENRSRRRIEWLVAALRHRDVEARMNAIDELAKAFNDNLGYVAEAAAADREQGVRRWEAALAQTGRARLEL